MQERLHQYAVEAADGSGFYFDFSSRQVPRPYMPAFGIKQLRTVPEHPPVRLPKLPGFGNMAAELLDAEQYVKPEGWP